MGWRFFLHPFDLTKTGIYIHNANILGYIANAIWKHIRGLP